MSKAEESLTQATKELSLNNDKISCLMIGNDEFRFESAQPSKEWLERAEKELRETPENVENALKVLRDLIAAEPDFYVPTDKEFLNRFLRPCKWYPESTFQLMRRFYKYRLNNPRYCANLQPSNEKTVLTAGLLMPLALRTSEGVRVVVVEGGKKWKPKEVSLDQMFRGVILFLEAAMAEPISQIAGVRVIIDMEGFSISQVTYFTPSFASAVVEFVQRCLPCRLKGIHIVNQPMIFSMVFAIFKPFLQEKLRKRIHFHGTDRSSLLKFFDAKVMPKKYGGENENIDSTIGPALYEYVKTFEDQYIEVGKHGYLKKA